MVVVEDRGFRVFQLFFSKPAVSRIDSPKLYIMDGSIFDRETN